VQIYNIILIMQVLRSFFGVNMELLRSWREKTRYKKKGKRRFAFFIMNVIERGWIFRFWAERTEGSTEGENEENDTNERRERAPKRKRGGKLWISFSLLNETN